MLSVLKHMHTDVRPASSSGSPRPSRRSSPAKITGCVVQGGIGNVGGASVVFPYVAQARRYGNDARNDATIKRC